MALFSDSCKIYAVRPVGDRVFSVLPLLDFFLFMKDFYFIRRFTQIGAFWYVIKMERGMMIAGQGENSTAFFRVKPWNCLALRKMLQNYPFCINIALVDIVKKK
ncbi:MAG: hypothetical protein GX946_03325 [Oligosphaeraceae bacterium]|nr:hypothetical protein [Oligosphaeraceae bacterium]